MGTSNPTENFFNMEELFPDRPCLAELEIPFTKEEKDEVIKSPPDKAPRPDGFNGAFIKACWPIIVEDFYELINDFYMGKINLQPINGPYISLIPKKDNPQQPRDFRPISPPNCSIKIITKLLANRLQKIILQLVHTNQYGFLKK